LTGYNRHNLKVEKNIQFVPTGFAHAVQSIIERRLRLGKGACMMTARTVTRQAIKRLGLTVNREAIGYEDGVLAAMYKITCDLMEGYGGKIWANATRNNRDHAGPSTRVYKFESD
jgi:hypothetical protein